MNKLLLLAPLLLLLVPLAHAETYSIDVTPHVNDVEASMSCLAYANCTDSGGLSHGANVTFTLNGVAFTYSSALGVYTGRSQSGSATTLTLNAVTKFRDAGNSSSTASVTTPATLVWVSSRVSTLLSTLTTGDIGAAIFAMDTYTIGSTIFWTFIVGAFSLAGYNFSGWKAMILVWVLGWGVWGGLIHGEGAVLAVLFMSVGLGLMIARVYFDRRTSF